MANLEIKYCDIPSYLRAGGFYRNLDNDDPEGIINIPAECFHPDGEKAADLEEFRQLLRAMVFWMLEDIPLGVLKFCEDHEVDVWDEGLVDLPDAVGMEVQPFLSTAYSKPGIVPLHDIIKSRRWDLIIHAVGRIGKNNNVADIVALCGNLRLLQHLHEEGFPWHEYTCAAASQNGHVDCLQYAHENGCPWDVNVHSYAAMNGHLLCMQYAFEQGLEWQVEVCHMAANKGHLDCLQFAHENGCPWDYEVYLYAASHGHLACMQYAFEQGLDEWHVDVCKEAALSGQLLCLKFAHEHGCPWDIRTTECAAQNGHVDCLRYALENACPVDDMAYNMASRNGHLECLQLLHQFDAPLCADAPVYATECSNSTSLQYLYENGCPWEEKTTRQAAFWGNIEPLRYAMEHGCPHSDDIVQYAARGKNFECLQYVVEEQGLLMERLAFKVASLGGNLNCVQYLFDQGCPFLYSGFSDEAEQWVIYDFIFRKDNPEFVLCVEFAVERGWAVCAKFIKYIVTRDEPCKLWLQKEGYYTVDDVLCSETVSLPDNVNRTIPPQLETRGSNGWCALM